MRASLRVCPRCRTEYDPPSTRCPFDGSTLIDIDDADEVTPVFGTPAATAGLGELGPYRLRSILGEGSMAVVYAAEHKMLGRRCAIKRLHHEHLVDPATVERFVGEARTLASIQHPNLVSIHDVVQEPGEAYLVMELLDGRDLQTVLETGSLAVDRALRIGVEICQALAPVHERGIVHRDVKPANVFLCIIAGREQVKMLDFGAARLLEQHGLAAEQRLEAAGTTLGSPAYMSPEQIAGDPLDPRSDIYAVGVVLYQMLSGAPPFVGETFSDVLLQHLHRAPAPLLERGVAVAAEIERLVLSCLEKDREKRPQSVEELARELRRLGPAPEMEATPSLHMATVASTPQRPWLVAAGAALVAAAVGFAWLSLRPGAAPAAASAPASPGAAETARDSSGPRVLQADVAAAATSAAWDETGQTTLHTVRVETTPPDVVVDPHGRAVACTTPCTLQLPVRPVEITLSKTGFRDETITVGEQETLVRLTLVGAGTRDRREHASARRGRHGTESEIPGAETINPFHESR